MRNKIGSTIFVCSLAVVVLVFVLRGNETPVPHRNSVDAQISQYSDKYITRNAVVADSQFKNIAFDASPKSSFFQNQIAAAIRAVKFFKLSAKKGEVREYGSWIWTPIMQMTPEYTESVLSDAKTNGVNASYVSIDTYMDIFTMPKGPERERQKELFSQKLEDFIIRANKKGIVVDAEAGWRNWAEDGNEYKAFAVINYVKNFNAEHKNKFRGFQYDVEPYLLESYKKDPSSVLKNFVELIDRTEYFMAASTLKFSVVVPDFYDGKDNATPKFSYNGKKDYTFGHLLNILDKRPDSSIIVMSYRNFAEGEDGAIEISKNEMRTAKRGSYDTKIIIAQETGDVPPPYITFHGTSKNYLFKEIEKINAAFSPQSNFGGIAVHYVNAFLALK